MEAETTKGGSAQFKAPSYQSAPSGRFIAYLTERRQVSVSSHRPS
jgi:hypothetical protein